VTLPCAPGTMLVMAHAQIGLVFEKNCSMDHRRVETTPNVSREAVSGALETANFVSPSGVLRRMSHSARDEPPFASRTGKTRRAQREAPRGLLDPSLRLRGVKEVVFASRPRSGDFRRDCAWWGRLPWQGCIPEPSSGGSMRTRVVLRMAAK
jgi:hypothetical protein